MATELPDFFIYYPTFHILICKECHTALPKNKAVEHLRKDHLMTQHQVINLGYQAIIERLDIFPLTRSLHQIQNDQPIAPIKGLSSFQARECSACGELFQSMNKANRHITKAHQHQRGHAQYPTIIDTLAQALQPNRYFFKVRLPSHPLGDHAPTRAGTSSPSPTPGPSQPHYAHHARVVESSDSDIEMVSARDVNTSLRAPSAFGPSASLPTRPGSSSQPDSGITPDLVDSLLRQYQEIQKPQPEQAKIYLSGSRDELNGFQLHTRYPEFLQQRSLPKLRNLFSLSLEHSDRIHDFLTACTTYIFAKGQKIIPLLSRHVRCLLNSFDIEHVTLRPFKPLQEAASAQKYARVLHSFLVFLLESYPYQVTRGPRDRDLNRLYAIDHMVKAGIQELKDLLLSPTLAEEDEEAPKASGPLQAGSARAYIGDDLDGENDEEDEIDLALDLGGDDGEEDLEDSGVLEKLERQAWQATSGFQFTQAAVHEGVALIEKLLIDLVTRHESYDMKGPIYAFLACFSIHYQEVTFKRIDRISQSYSAVIYAMQLVAINHHWTPWIRRILEAKEDGQDQALANAAPFHAVFGPWLQTYFKHQSPYPLGDLLSFRAYALYYNTISSVQGNQVIEQAPHHLRFHHLSVSRLQLQEFFQKSTLDLAHSLVGSLLIWEDAQLFNQIQLGEAARFEDFAMEGNGFNFLTLNEDYQHHYQPYLVKKILDDPTRAKEWFKPAGNRLHLIPLPAERYLFMAKKFLLHLLVLVHMTSGAPARGTEIIPLLASNSMINRRNLFLDPKSKLFLIRLRYSKVLATTGMERNAVRAIPRAPSHILLVYLVVVEPFIHYLHQALKLRNRRSLLFFNSGRPPYQPPGQ
ncbi:hypothetical protein MAP00_005390 [Monascus purpureus]|nr:hypothetical protein MAP00_005390 [Monascus purpureus]